MTNQLKELKKKYEAVMDAINILKADGDLARLCNLRDTFDDTFDTFFDNLAEKYNRDELELTNTMMEGKLDNEDLAELVKFYEGYIDNLTDEFIDLGGDLRYLDTINGTVAFKGTEYTLTQQAYIDNDGTSGDVVYKASAVDIKGVEYQVIWETTLEFDESQELYNLEQCDEDELSEEDKERMQELIDNDVNSALCEDESNACDWDEPVSVEEI